MRILYVEDNDDLRETICMLMEGEGRTVVACDSAERALELDSSAPFDVVVTDVSLPGISGTDFAKQLLAVDPQRCVVLCSGYELGAYPLAWGRNVRTLRKPFDIEELDTLLAQVTEFVASRPVPLGP